jgi:hypothetical protein
MSNGLGTKLVFVSRVYPFPSVNTTPKLSLNVQFCSGDYSVLIQDEYSRK